MKSFEEEIRIAAQKSIVKQIQQGDWLKSSYNDRVEIPPSYLMEIWNLVDHKKVKENLASRIEQELADRIVNHMAAEMATDIKQILGIPERREAIRSLARENLDRICSLGKEES